MGVESGDGVTGLQDRSRSWCRSMTPLRWVEASRTARGERGELGRLSRKLSTEFARRTGGDLEGFVTGCIDPSLFSREKRVRVLSTIVLLFTLYFVLGFSSFLLCCGISNSSGEVGSLL